MNTPAVNAQPPSLGPLDFELSEYHARVSAVQAEMAQRGADLLLVDQIDHLAYLFGYLATAARYQAALIPAVGEPWLIVRELDLGTFLDQSWSRAFETFADDEDSHQRVTQAIARFAPKCLAIESDSNILTIERLSLVRQGNPGMRIIDFSGVLWEMRLIKSEQELAYIRHAAGIADAIVLAATQTLEEGRSDRQTLATMYEASIRRGADNTRAAIIGRMTGEDALLGKVTGQAWQAGERLFLESTPQYRGYSARLVRPAVIGQPSGADIALAHQLIDIQDRQIAAMRPGAVAGDIDELCRGEVLRAGLKTTYTQITGYTLGYQAVPRVSDHTRILAPGQSWVLQPGMVFHVVLQTPAFAWSETVAINHAGAECLTRLPRTLLSK